MTHATILAAEAIDAKCRIYDHYRMISILQKLECLLAENVAGKQLVTKLMFDESDDVNDYVDLLIQIDHNEGY